jgi:hypothetical protein
MKAGVIPALVEDRLQTLAPSREPQAKVRIGSSVIATLAEQFSQTCDNFYKKQL